MPGRGWFVALGLLLITPGAHVAAQADADGRPGWRAPVPFGVGERLEYEVKFGGIRVGAGFMEVSKMDSIRGREVWHTSFGIRGGLAFYRVNDRYESWFDTRSLASLRYHQQIDEGSYERESRFEIYPDRQVFVDAKGAEQPTAEDPLDDGSFLYFLRTIPLEVGREYTFNRYFRLDRNPVRIRVLRRERVPVPAGTFDAIVVQPIIKTKGIFSENGRAEVWLSDDEHRIVLQMKSRFSRFSLNLFLKSFRLANRVSAARPVDGAPVTPESLPVSPPQ
ncbi:MAG: DUF3108 domain-containing protein [Gemmatimonadaceae bacterium]